MNIIKKITVPLLFLVLFNVPITTNLKRIFQGISLKSQKITPRKIVSNLRLKRFNRKNIGLWWNQLRNKIFQYLSFKQKPTLDKPVIQLLPPGKSLILPLNPWVANLERRALNKIRDAFSFDNIEWNEITEKIQEIREENLRHLTSHDAVLEDFSYTHKELPDRIREILYDVLNTYNINPQRIKIVTRHDYTSTIMAFVTGNTLYFNTRFFNNSKNFFVAILAHEIGHMIQSDSKIFGLLNHTITKKITQGDIIKIGLTEESEVDKIILITSLKEERILTINEENALHELIKTTEYIADVLIASRNVKIARAKHYFFQNDEIPDLLPADMILFNEKTTSSEENIYEVNQTETLLGGELYRYFYPLHHQSQNVFSYIMKKIWGGNWNIKKD